MKQSLAMIVSALAAYSKAETIWTLEDASSEWYADFAVTMDTYDYQWEPYTVQTEDGWLLTLFHVTGRYGERPS